jgi:hypothetical protein
MTTETLNISEAQSLRNSVNQAGSLWACEYSTSCASEMFKVSVVILLVKEEFGAAE